MSFCADHLISCIASLVESAIQNVGLHCTALRPQVLSLESKGITPVDADTCQTCDRRGIDCVRVQAIRFRQVSSVHGGHPSPQRRTRRARYSYGRNHTFVELEGPVRFVTNDDDGNDSKDSASVENEADLDAVVTLSESPPREPDQGHHTQGVRHDQLSLADTVVDQSRLHRHNTYETFSPQSHRAQNALGTLSSPTAYSATSPSSLYQASALWPLQRREEATLMRHFVLHLAPWFDACDPLTHFASIAPQRAAHYPLLLNAILAHASLHRNRLLGLDESISNEYHDRCLQIMIPVLNSPQEIPDENFLAAVVILRSTEEMSDDDKKCHLLGTSRIINSMSAFATSGGLGEAASWVALRQDIYVSLTSGTPLHHHLHSYTSSSSFSNTDDGSWANRIVHIFAEALSLTFESGNENFAEKWHELEMAAEAWLNFKPETFSPLLAEIERSNTDTFPSVWMLLIPHVVGMQYYHLAKIMLATCDLRRSGTGFDGFHAWREIEATIRYNVRMVVGLAISNKHVKNANFQASHILFACGSSLRDPIERAAAIEFLREMERDMGWRTENVIEHLTAQWQ